MARVLVFSFVLLCSIASHAKRSSSYSSGYVRQSGTVVRPYHRSIPNNYRWDNYSSKGNINPYTNERGYSNPYNPREIR